VVVDFTNLQMTVSHDMAIAHAYVTYKALSADGQELRSMNNRLTMALKNINGNWKIIHEHSSAPLEPDTLKAILKRS
ncbi:MAG: nuclear transport factor 2 family protein, partial [Chloroflexi bacterium]|nr:nuclear transport factor 2 family protein [Chloroflexota bacterium]